MAITLAWVAPGPVSQSFAESDAFSRKLIGPMMGGRRWTMVADIVRRPGRLAIEGKYQRHWRWLAAAPDMAKLEKMVAAWHARVAPSQGKWDDRTLTHRIDYPIARLGEEVATATLDIQFLALDRADHRRRLTQVPATGVWLDSGRDMDEGVYLDAVDVAGLYPAMLTEDALWCGVAVTSRMPGADHWLAKRTDIAEFRQPGGQSASAEAAHLPQGFYSRQATRGKGDEWVRVNVDAEFARYGRRPELAQVIAESYALESAA